MIWAVEVKDWALFCWFCLHVNLSLGALATPLAAIEQLWVWACAVGLHTSC